MNKALVFPTSCVREVYPTLERRSLPRNSIDSERFRYDWIEGKPVCSRAIETVLRLIGVSRRVFVPREGEFMRVYYEESAVCEIQGTPISLSSKCSEGAPGYVYTPALCFRIEKDTVELGARLIENSTDCRDLTNVAVEGLWSDLLKGACVRTMRARVFGRRFFYQELGLSVRPPNKLLEVVEGLRGAAQVVAQNILPSPYDYGTEEYKQLVKETALKACNT